MSEVTIEKPPCKPPTVDTGIKKKQKISGVAPKVYTPFKQPLADLDVPRDLKPLIKDTTPEPGFLRIWPDSDEDTPLVDSRFGMVPRGCVLSYQQPLSASDNSRVSHSGMTEAPNFNFPHLTYPPIVLDEQQQLHFDSLRVTEEQSQDYERQTREQSFSKDWYRLRNYRLTASNFKSVCSRRKNFETLADRLLRGSKIQTAAMKYGIEHEDEVAQFYAEHFNRDVFKVGFVINPSVPHLGCSPDRRVYDPSESSPWGLFEIKCSMKDERKDVPYLQQDLTTGEYSLKKSHLYYYQVIDCLGISGSGWSEFFVQCQKEYHYERIYKDDNLFSNICDDLHQFYFNYFLPASVASGN